MTLSAGGGSTFAGTFYKNGFQMAGGSPAVSSGDREGGATRATDGLGRLQAFAADLDVVGNVLTLGSWKKSNAAVAGLALQYSEDFTLPGAPAPSPDGTALIYLTGSRQNTSWLWNHAGAAAASANAPMMLLAGADHSLSLYDPAAPAVPAIILNPSGRSRFDKPVRIAPQGDLDMGDFKHGPGEPQ